MMMMVHPLQYVDPSANLEGGRWVSEPMMCGYGAVERFVANRTHPHRIWMTNQLTGQINIILAKSIINFVAIN